MTLDETVESYIGLVDMFFEQFIIYPYMKTINHMTIICVQGEPTPYNIYCERFNIKKTAENSGDYFKLHFIRIGDYLSGMLPKSEVKAQTKWLIDNIPNFDSKFREYCLVQMQKYHKNRDEAMYTVSKLDEFTPFSYEVVGDKHILKNLKTGGIIEPYGR
jgi:hypothetical protein